MQSANNRAGVLIRCKDVQVFKSMITLTSHCFLWQELNSIQKVLKFKYQILMTAYIMNAARDRVHGEWKRINSLMNTRKMQRVLHPAVRWSISSDSSRWRGSWPWYSRCFLRWKLWNAFNKEMAQWTQATTPSSLFMWYILITCLISISVLFVFLSTGFSFVSILWFIYLKISVTVLLMLSYVPEIIQQQLRVGACALFFSEVKVK